MNSLPFADCQTLLEHANREIDAKIRSGELFSALDFASILITVSGQESEILAGFDTKAVCYDKLGAHDLELLTYNDAVDRLASSAEPDIRDGLNSLLYNKGVTLSNLDRNAEALSTYDFVIQRSKGAISADARDTLARAMYNRAAIIKELSTDREAIAAFEGLISSLSDDDEPSVRAQVAKAYAALGQLYSNEKDFPKAIDYYQKAEDIFPFTLDQIPSRLQNSIRSNQGVTLAKSNRVEEAVRIFSRIIRELEHAPDEESRLVAYGAFLNRAIAQQKIDKEQSLSDIDAAIAGLRTAISPTASLMLKSAEQLKSAFKDGVASSEPDAFPDVKLPVGSV
ncbi:MULTISPECIES: tetratricopeptide repeat protein [Sphingomonas]|uniref:tetratricopeptide repeat protein n=1 Tax=Sphingomonas TaxID=13687 RepID=UPI000DEEF36A|nr:MULTISPECIES: tetratricopeptide repeat protein [Sphingomonas]